MSTEAAPSASSMDWGRTFSVTIICLVGCSTDPCERDPDRCEDNLETPTLELSLAQVKQFDFSWPMVPGAEYYQLHESPSEGEPFVQVGDDITEASVSLTMPLHARAHASYKLLACNASGCSESDPVALMNMVNNLADAVGYIKASNTSLNATFGSGLALSSDGNVMAVGAADENSVAYKSGAAYVFARSGNAWSEQAYVKASNVDMLDGFGRVVAISGDGVTMAVGASNEDNSAGAVYVFVRSGDAWSEQAYVKASNMDPNDSFGSSVALSSDGDTMVIGAIYESSSATGIDGEQDDNTALQSGAVYVFVRDDAMWSQQAYVKASTVEPYDYFGQCVALSSDGNTMAVGADGEDSASTQIDGNQADNDAVSAGAAYVFVRNGGMWSQQAYVKASNAASVDLFGASVALSSDGDTMAVGAREEDSSATGIDGDPSDESAENAGATYVFVRSGDAWSQQAYIKASNTQSDDYFGSSVALSSDGNVMAVGATHEDSGAMGIDGDQTDNATSRSGAVYVFERDGDTWSQLSYVKASDPAAGDRFGQSVAVSSDASTLAVGAPAEDSDATGISGEQTGDAAHDAGAVYLY